MVSQIHEVNPRIYIHYPDPSIDRSMKIAQQYKQVFKTYYMMFKELKEKKEAANITMFL